MLRKTIDGAVGLMKWLELAAEGFAFLAFYLILAFSLVVSLASEKLPADILPYASVVFVLLVLMALFMVVNRFGGTRSARQHH